MRRSCFDEVGGFDEAFRCFEDLELFLRLSKICRFHHIESGLVRYHFSEDGLTQEPTFRLAGQRRLVRLYWKDLVRESPLFLTREAFRLGRRSLRQSLASFGRRPTRT